MARFFFDCFWDSEEASSNSLSNWLGMPCAQARMTSNYTLVRVPLFSFPQNGPMSVRLFICGRTVS